MFTDLAENIGNINDKLNLYVALAPVVYLGNVQVEWVKNFVHVYKLLKFILDAADIYEFFGRKWVAFSDDFC